MAPAVIAHVEPLRQATAIVRVQQHGPCPNPVVSYACGSEMGGFRIMLFDFKEIPARECYKLLVSTVTPRPIAWVVSQDAKGILNAGAFSFFNAFAGDPPVVGIGVGSHEPGRPKDTRANILETGQFVVNLVSEKNAEQMNITAIEFDPSVNELEQA